MLLLDGGSSPDDDAVELAAERAARATRAGGKPFGAGHSFETGRSRMRL
jgi:hypothetical protein